MTKPNSKKEKTSAGGSRSTTRKTPQQKQAEVDALTIQEILHLGEQAASELNSDVYNLAHEMALNEILDQLIATEPAETQLRESLYHEAQALGRSARRLKAFVNAAQQVNLTEAQKAQRDLQRFEEDQGFFPDGYPGEEQFTP